ncbi:hypothetical protein BJX65DRAFT_261513 [Aspergillus insuetus]
MSPHIIFGRKVRRRGSPVLMQDLDPTDPSRHTSGLRGAWPSPAGNRHAITTST